MKDMKDMKGRYIKESLISYTISKAPKEGVKNIADKIRDKIEYIPSQLYYTLKTGRVRLFVQ